VGDGLFRSFSLIRFTDPISGRLIEVDYNPASGERDYRPIG
jgi:hypothetical protein